MSKKTFTLREIKNFSFVKQAKANFLHKRSFATLKMTNVSHSEQCEESHKLLYKCRHSVRNTKSQSLSDENSSRPSLKKGRSIGNDLAIAEHVRNDEGNNDGKVSSRFTPHTSRKCAAFTLAEVLVTLGIIGVISAMTLPTLVKNHQRQVFVTQLHKVYNQVSQAIELYMNDTRTVKLSETRLRNNSTELKQFFNSYFKVAKDCEGSYVPCFADEYKSLDGSKTIELKRWKCNVTLALADGTAICADSQLEEDTKDENGQVIKNDYSGIHVLVFEFDINGKQGPNIYGRDYFSFIVDDNGNIIDNNKAKHENGVNPSEIFGFFGKIVDDGWKMEY